MLVNNKIELGDIEVDIFNVIIGYQDKQNMSDKKKRSQRIFTARRAIEKHQESLQLAKHLAETWH